MTRCVVLLRGINVGRGNRLAMADLSTSLEAAGCSDVTTYLQSGNAVVEADPHGLAARVEEALPLAVRVVVFTAEELAGVVAGCPWRDRADAEPKLVHVAFLSRRPEPLALSAIVGRHGDDEVAAGERCLYLSYTVSSLESPLAKALARARLEAVMTARNWTTVLKVAELAGAE